MNQNCLWSLRLGFSSKQAAAITAKGIASFLEASFAVKNTAVIPDFLNQSPKTKEELAQKRAALKTATPEQKKEIRKEENLVSSEMKNWWIQKMIQADFPLHEKMTLFLHNHYVASFQKVKVNFWIYQHNETLRKHAFGNFKTLTKEVLKTNSMVRYLDNTENKKGKINENLSRELLELFTLGIGNYTEEDIKNGAKALAGLGIGEIGAEYREKFEDNSDLIYFGKKGVLKLDDIVDIIFEQKNSPYLMTRKILKWFIYDSPPEELVHYYGDYFRKVDFEFRPLLNKIFTEEFDKKTAGSKIKNPLEFNLQLCNELNLESINTNSIAQFTKQQSMDLFNQPNVKGWDGGKSWLTTEIYLQRNQLADKFCQGKHILKDKNADENQPFLDWKKGDHLKIIKELSDRLLFEVSSENQKDFETILKYDFKADSPSANQAVLRLFNDMIKKPEFQLI